MNTKPTIITRLFLWSSAKLLSAHGWQRTPEGKWSTTLPSGTRLVSSRADALYRTLSNHPNLNQ